jgi:hypothetical protein
MTRIEEDFFWKRDEERDFKIHILSEILFILRIRASSASNYLEKYPTKTPMLIKNGGTYTKAGNILVCEPRKNLTDKNVCAIIEEYCYRQNLPLQFQEFGRHEIFRAC